MSTDTYLNFENCGLYFDMCIGENIIECEECGKLIRRKGKNKRYCNRCAKASLQKNRVEINRKYYIKNKK